MNDFRAMLADLRRPRLLVRAARHGLQDYRRDRDLRRLIAPETGLAPDVALARLLDEEARIETTRRSGDASYSIARHVELLIAMMAEARLIAG
jgi:hypothetical protein